MALKIESDTPLKVERVFARGGKVVRETSVVGTKEQIKKIEGGNGYKKKSSLSVGKKTKKQTRVLKKPKAKITGISATKTLKSFAQTTGPVVREVEQKEIVQDNRSQFFREEFRKEEMGVNKWLS